MTKHNCNSFTHQSLKYLGLGGLKSTYKREALLDYKIVRGAIRAVTPRDQSKMIKELARTPINPSQTCHQTALQQSANKGSSSCMSIFCLGSRSKKQVQPSINSPAAQNSYKSSVKRRGTPRKLQPMKGQWQPQQGMLLN